MEDAHQTRAKDLRMVPATRMVAQVPAPGERNAGT